MCFMATSCVVLHTQPKPGLAEREMLHLAAKTQQQQSQYQHQHQGKGNALKITNYIGVWGKKLNLNYLGFSRQTFA